MKELLKLADNLDNHGFHKEADMIDLIISKSASEDSDSKDQKKREMIAHPLELAVALGLINSDILSSLESDGEIEKEETEE